MTQPIFITLFTVGLAGLLGFAAQRASICTVRAVGEMFTTGRAIMLLSFGKTVLWVIFATLALRMMLPVTTVSYGDLSLYSFLGGFLFGVGATLNGGCAISMLANLASGKLSMLLSIAGMVIGATGYLLYAPAGGMPVASVATYMPTNSEAISTIVTALLSLWAARELYRMWRGRSIDRSILGRLLEKRYRLSTAAFLIGASNAALLVFYGSWSFTNLINRTVMQRMGMVAEIHWIYWLLVASVIGGMLASAVLRGKFRLEWRPDMRWPAQFAGGLLMGLGAAMVPGGNDELIFRGIPSLSLSALVAYGAIILGIAMALKVMLLMGQKIETIDCSGDVCKIR